METNARKRRKHRSDIPKIHENSASSSTHLSYTVASLTFISEKLFVNNTNKGKGKGKAVP